MTREAITIRKVALVGVVIIIAAGGVASAILFSQSRFVASSISSANTSNSETLTYNSESTSATSTVCTTVSVTSVNSNAIGTAQGYLAPKQSSPFSATTSTTTESISTSTYVPPYFNFTSLISLFSSVSIEYVPQQNLTWTSSYNPIGNFIVNGTQTTGIKITDNQSSILAYYDKNYDVVMVNDGRCDTTGFQAEGALKYSFAIGIFALYFEMEGDFKTMMQNSELNVVGTSTQKFGNVTMNVTTYNAPKGVFEGLQQNDVTISMGRVAGTNSQVLVFDSIPGFYMKFVSAARNLQQ